MPVDAGVLRHVTSATGTPGHDAAVVGGVDSLCLTTLYGFGSLGLLSPVACRPFDAALLFARDRTSRTIAELEITMDAQAQEISRMSDAALEHLRTGNPCARALPLLAALAGARPQSVTLERDAGQTLSISVRTDLIEPGRLPG